MKQLSSVNPGETKTPLTFDFTSYLVQGETVTSAVCNVDVWAGTDASPSAILDGSATIVGGTTALQRVTGGIDGVDYRVRCLATTVGVSPARTIALVSLLPVRNA
jgi:hypothetical protein